MSEFSRQSSLVKRRIEALNLDTADNSRSSTRASDAEVKLKRAVGSLERAVGSLVEFVPGEDEEAGRIAVVALLHFDTVLSGQPSHHVGEPVIESVRLRQAISRLERAIVAVAAFATCEDEDARIHAVATLGRFNAILIKRLGVELCKACDEATRLRVYKALGKLGVREPGRASIIALAAIGLHLDDDQEAIAIAPLREARLKLQGSTNAVIPSVEG